jgi:hypothetical protein
MMLVTSSVILHATTADSSTWLYQQNGSLGANSDFSFYGDPMTDAGGGILDFGPKCGIESPTFVSESANLISNGYSIEVRVKVTSTGLDNYGFGIMPADGAQLGWFGVRANDVMTEYAPGVASWASGVNGDDFHVFRVTHSPSSAYFDIWKDGVLITDVAKLYAPAYTTAFLNFGNISQNGATGQLDYARWTPGVYDPPTQSTVPEPSSLLVMVSGLLGVSGFVIRRRK